MKFTKKYEQYLGGEREKGLPLVGLKKLKKLLKACRREMERQERIHEHVEIGETSASIANLESNKCDNHCDGSCTVCDGTFFPSLLEEMSAVVGCFNERAKKLLEMHLASGFKKYLLWVFGKSSSSHSFLIQEGKDLVTYAIINSIAMRKILKKYDKLHHSTEGQAFKAKAQNLHIEILQSPWLCELMAFYINLRKSKVDNKAPLELFGDCSLTFDDDKPTLSCCLFESMRVDIDLTCSICLETVFDAVSLNCGHIFCYMCCCKAASVTIINGLEVASLDKKCPLCRREGVYPGAVHLEELNVLLSESCPEEWDKRRQFERQERIRLAKEHWDFQCRAFVGI
ncbi:SPX (SYG1/Pho81/XPR1) domain-containing protein [Rhynchospora pubera]|uniref:RING-type E3 ubiquitin transferase n=1 Tax=Rhynchospora pubera TaxID=906938 RepID=A0AAV8CCW5_9POAL|nr:SPX (SYG1/Pho81/XPR1) domain-containing protein [Rhynchospora pubera]KAJ4793962.1 SPX (SYG1/Pho81/XPR1) domain-containing protein [Rhynchospora pubera]